LVALFDGAPTDFSDNPHNLKWQFSRDDGILFFTELHRETRLKGNPGKIKGGIYLHQHLFPPPGNEFGDRDSLDRNNNGLYAIMDQEIWRRPSGKRALAFFLQFGISPRSHNLNQYYIGSGLNLSGVAGRGGNDNLGIAVAHDGLRTVTGKETAIEITYSFPLFNYFMLQPDIQYIINPAGTGSELDNCIVASLRFNLNF
jgi:porin